MEQANPQTQIIERDLRKLGERFDRHLEIYAQNGKELYGLKSSVESLKSTIERQESRDKDNLAVVWTETKKNTDDISSINITLGKLVVRVSLIAAVASSVASIVGVFIIESMLLS